jgi:hypothetical protein
MSGNWRPAAGPPVIDEVGRILLPLPPGDFRTYSPVVEIAGRTFDPKAEYHITLVGSDLAASIAASPGGSGRLIELLAEVSAWPPWRYRLLDEYVHVRKVEGELTNESVIVMAEVEQAAEFYDALERLALAPLPRPPLHVTLYTYGDERGIGLPTLEALKQRTVSRLPHRALAVTVDAATGSD